MQTKNRNMNIYCYTQNNAVGLAYVAKVSPELSKNRPTFPNLQK